MVIYVAHDESIAAPQERHPVFVIHIGFENARMTLDRMAAQARVSEVGIKKAEGLFSFPLYCRG